MGTLDPEPSAPPPSLGVPVCEGCGADATLSCGLCTEMYLCEREACFDAAHPRVKDREAHRCRVVSCGAETSCKEHPGFDLCLVCDEPGCGGALMCLRCVRHGSHSGHRCSDILQSREPRQESVRDSISSLGESHATAARELKALMAQEGSLLFAWHTSVLRAQVTCLEVEEAAARHSLEAEEELTRQTHRVYCHILAEQDAMEQYLCGTEELMQEGAALQRIPGPQALRFAQGSNAFARRAAELWRVPEVGRRDFRIDLAVPAGPLHRIDEVRVASMSHTRCEEVDFDLGFSLL